MPIGFSEYLVPALRSGSGHYTSHVPGLDLALSINRLPCLSSRALVEPHVIRTAE